MRQALLKPRLRGGLQPSGITLLELMVSVSVSTLLVLCLMHVLGSTSGIYAESERSVERLRDGRAGMGIIRSDMVGWLGPSNGLPILHDRQEGNLSTRWGFFTSQPSKAQERNRAPGDLCYVLYYTAVTPDANNGVSRKLFRRFLSSLDTFPLLGHQAFQPPSFDPAQDDVVAFNVLDFRCEFRRRDGNGAWIDAKTPEEIQSAGEVTIVLRVLTNEAARQLATEADWSPGGSPATGFDFDDNEDDDASASTFRTRFQLER